MLSGQAPEFVISTIAAFSTGFGFSLSLLYHAPIRIKSFGTFQPLEEKGCRAERPQRPRSEATRWFSPTPPVPFHGTQKIVGSKPCPKGSTFMVGCQHRMAHGVVSKDEDLGSISGVERLTNQLTWLFQHKNGFPVPAQSNYRNILASSNST